MHRREGVKCAHKCKTCKGKGKIAKMQQMAFSFVPVDTEAPKKTKKKTCPDCSGTGFGCDCEGFVLDSTEVDAQLQQSPTLFVINYDIIHAWEQWLLSTKDWAARNIPIVVFDEAHYLMSYKARRSVSCRNVARRAERRIGLTATPMQSRPRDLWNVVDTLSPGRFGKSFPFLLRYAGAHQIQVATDKTVWDTKGSSNLDELGKRMEFFMLRRTKKQVALELPPKTRQMIELEVNANFCTPMRSALGGDQALLAALRLAADGKLPQAIDIIANHAVGGESNIVVFCHRKWIAETIAAALRKSRIEAQVITGKMPMKKRVEVVDSQPRVLCCTMDSTAVGIDLSYANVGVFVELDYVPAKLIQAEGRLDRFGQKRNVLIQYLIATSTADEVIRDVVIAKMESFENVVGKLDGGLKQALEGDVLDDVAQLKKLYEKIVKARET
jgi:SNF2 family DNA or RNA helicase